MTAKEMVERAAQLSLARVLEIVPTAIVGTGSRGELAKPKLLLAVKRGLFHTPIYPKFWRGTLHVVSQARALGESVHGIFSILLPVSCRRQL